MTSRAIPNILIPNWVSFVLNELIGWIQKKRKEEGEREREKKNRIVGLVWKLELEYY